MYLCFHVRRLRLGLTDASVCVRVLQNLADSNQAIRELQAKQDTLSDRLAQQKQQLTEVSSINYALDTEEINLQDAKERVRSCTANCVLLSSTRFLHVNT